MTKVFTSGLLALSVACSTTSGSNTSDAGNTGTVTPSCSGTLCEDPLNCVGSDADTIDVSSSACAAMGLYDPVTHMTSITVTLAYAGSTRASSIQIFIPGFITTGTFTDGTVGALPATFAPDVPYEHYSNCYRPNLNAFPSWVQAQAQLPDGGQLGSFSLTLSKVTQGQNAGSDLTYFVNGHAHLVCVPEPRVVNETATGTVTLDVTF